MKEFISVGESAHQQKPGRWKDNFIKDNFGLMIKDYELISRLKKADKNNEDHVEFVREDGTHVRINIEKQYELPDSL
ncbi:hypothetical protein H8D83_02595 [Candidatus Woesearchaeota archaeon]|nr:hypothetical protein [Candidatus Woesearchaeota archaeon]MBL7051169.1 hypothetical protein [Candidatus Woesearchaeota archaeon]